MAHRVRSSSERLSACAFCFRLLPCQTMKKPALKILFGMKPQAIGAGSSVMALRFKMA